MDLSVPDVLINVLNVTKETYVQLVLQEETIQTVLVKQDIMMPELLIVLLVNHHVLLVMD